MGNLCSRIANKFSSIRYECIPHEDDLIVEVDQGILRGREFTSVLTDETYYGFLGIPYAKPPVGNLRFQAPQPPESWTGVYNAAYERDMCKQVTMVIWGKTLIFGSEDCLHLNVYSPEIPSKIKVLKPVMVFIHGGGFCLGSGSRKCYSPDYLIPRDIILVTMNYRLHVLGFLNMGLPECPGNAGMKDQVMALQWIKKNIVYFGGDPENITIFGESAGSSAVHYHLLSPLSKGLFHKAIMESGTAASPWGITHNPDEQAMQIGRLCGYDGNDKNELLKHLRKQSAWKLTNAVADLLLAYRKVYPARFLNVAPSVESIKDGAFLPDSPHNLAKIATPVPTMFGVNDKEGMLIFMGVMTNELITKMKEDFTIFLKHNFKMDPSLVPETSLAIKNFYFKDQEVDMNTAAAMIDLYSDLTFFYGYESIEFLINSDNPPFIYEFTYMGPLNFITKFINFIKRTKIKGASHGDELFYLFYPQMAFMFPSLTGECLSVIEDMTLMWTNFAKRGNPSGRIKWKPSTPLEPCYLQIDKRLSLRRGKVYEKRLCFMKNLLQTVMDPETKPFDIFDELYLHNLLSE